MDNRGKTMIADKFDFGFAVDWMRKDLGLCLEEAKRNGARLPVTALVDQFADVQAMGGRRWDTSSLIKRLRAGQGPRCALAFQLQRTGVAIAPPEAGAFRGAGSARPPVCLRPPVVVPVAGDVLTGAGATLAGAGHRLPACRAQLLRAQHLEHADHPLHARDLARDRGGAGPPGRHPAQQVHRAALGHHAEGVGLQVGGVHEGGAHLAGDEGVVGTLGERGGRHHPQLVDDAAHVVHARETICSACWRAASLGTSPVISTCGCSW